MGKKSVQLRNKVTSSPTSASNEAEAGSPEMLKLKDEGNRLFGRKEYQKALEAYDRALKVANPESKEDLALLHSNKAACYMMFQRFKEAVNECSNALDAVPAYHKALVRRAKAYEQMGHFKQALSDIQKANKTDTANPEIQESEKRLRDIVTGKRQGGVLAANGTAGRKLGKQRQQLFVFTAKVSFENETRVIHLANTLTYAELLELVKNKFPNAYPCQIKYLDREADLITITDKTDLQQAMNDAMEAAERSASLPGHGTRGLPLQSLLAGHPLKLQLLRCKEEEVPKPPQEEEFMLAQLNEMRRQLQAQQLAAAQKKAAETSAANQQPETFEIDQWIVDFAQLFREQLGVDPDKHLDLTNVAWEKLQAALDTAVQSDKAPALFDAAADKFQEVSAHGMLQWGNVFFCQGKRTIDKAAAAGRDIAEVAEEAEVDFKKAEEKYEESRRIKADYYDAFVSLGNLDFERGKLALGLAIPPPTPSEEPAEGAEKKSEAELQAAQEATNKEQQAVLKAALGKITAEKLKVAQPFFDRTWAKFQEALDQLPEEDKGKKLKPVQEGQPVEDENNPWAHCMVMWGNLLYEASQMYAAAGRDDWKATLDQAVENFRAAGCPENDIRAALGNHTQVEHLDLPPIKEPEKAPEKAKPAGEEVNGKAEEDAPKGLPSLGPKPKKKSAAAPSEPAKQAEA
ncbi:probable protein CLMP1 [Coccomyxa sp. Obi]|nr:probable protein CLMP1 [Coccomyxa sp. Obi]